MVIEQAGLRSSKAQVQKGGEASSADSCEVPSTVPTGVLCG